MRAPKLGTAAGTISRFALVVFALLPVLAGWEHPLLIFLVFAVLFAGFLCDRHYELSRPAYLLLRVLGWLPVLYVFLAISLLDQPLLLTLANTFLGWLLLYSFAAARRGYVMTMNLMAGLVLFLVSLTNRDFLLLLGFVVYFLTFLPAAAEAALLAAARKRDAVIADNTPGVNLRHAARSFLFAGGALLVVTALFLFAPRAELAALKSIGRTNIYQARMDLFRVGNGGRPLDHRVMMQVRTPVRGNYRGQVFSFFTGLLWKAGAGDPAPLPATGDPRRPIPLPAAGAEQWTGRRRPVVQEFAHQPGFTTPLHFALLQPAEIRTDEKILARAPDGAILGLPRPNQRYAVVSNVPESPRQAGAPNRLDRQQQAEYLQLPPHLSPRVRDLAQRIAGNRADDYQKARALAAHLRTRCRYDLNVTMPLMRVPEITDHFLFTTRAGFCEHFATALTVLCRCVGIPARLVTGFAPGEYDPDRDLSVVRALHAHAWTEVFLRDRGWYTFDATPPGAFPADAGQLGDDLAGRLGAWSNRLYNFVDADQDRARELSLALARLPLVYLQSASAAAGPGAAFVGVALLLLFLLLPGALLWRRARRQRAAAAAAADPVRRLFAAIRAALARAGLPDHPALTPREFAGQRPDPLPPPWRPIREELAALVPDYYRWRFDPREDTPRPAGLIAELERLGERGRELAPGKER